MKLVWKGVRDWLDIDCYTIKLVHSNQLTKKKFVQFVVCFEANLKYCLVLLSFDVLMVTELLIFSRTTTPNLFMQKHQKTFPEIE